MGRERREYLKIGRCIYCNKDIPKEQNDLFVCLECHNRDLDTLKLMSAVNKIKRDFEDSLYEEQLRLDKLRQEQLSKHRNRRKYYSGF
jgi:hypothetical protein